MNIKTAIPWRLRQPMPVYTVREDHDGWYTDHWAERSGPFETKAEAETLARAGQGLKVEVEIRTIPRDGVVAA